MSGPRLSDADVAELRAMHALARTVNGSTPSGAPPRQASEEFTARVAAALDAGVTLYRAAKQLGVSQATLRDRLGRHGYRPVRAGVAGTPAGRYVGRSRVEGREQADRCEPVVDGDGQVIGRAVVSPDITDEGRRALAALVEAVKRLHEANPDPERDARYAAGQARIRERNERLRGEP